MPYTHGLPGSIVPSLILGAAVAWFTPGKRGATAMLVAAAAFSHWVLDLIVHVPDLPLYDNAAKVGFGLWRHVILSFPLEIALLGFGAWLYAQTETLKRPAVFWGFVIFLAAMQVYANFGPPPASENAMAIMALVFYVVLAAMAAAVERYAVTTATPGGGLGELAARFQGSAASMLRLRAERSDPSSRFTRSPPAPRIMRRLRPSTCTSIRSIR